MVAIMLKARVGAGCETTRRCVDLRTGTPRRGLVVRASGDAVPDVVGDLVR